MAEANNYMKGTGCPLTTFQVRTKIEIVIEIDEDLRVATFRMHPSFIITVNYVDGTTATVTLSPEALATQGLYALD